MLHLVSLWSTRTRLHLDDVVQAFLGICYPPRPDHDTAKALVTSALGGYLVMDGSTAVGLSLWRRDGVGPGIILMALGMHRQHFSASWTVRLVEETERQMITALTRTPYDQGTIVAMVESRDQDVRSIISRAAYQPEPGYAEEEVAGRMVTFYQKKIPLVSRVPTVSPN